MRRVGVLVSLSAVLMAYGCGGSGGGGTGGEATGGSSGGKGGAGTGGAGGKGGSAGTSGAAGASGSAGTNGAAGASGAAGTSGGAGTTGNAGASGSAGATGSAGNSGVGGGSAGAGGSADGGAMCGDDTGSDRGESCNVAAANGPCVTPMLVTGTVPTPTGGTILPGTYNLVTDLYYGPLDANFSQKDLRQTLVFSNVTLSSLTLDQVATSGTATNRSHGTVGFSGTTVNYVPSCPAADAGGDTGGSANYTFATLGTQSAFVLIQENDGLTEVSTFVKAN